MLLVFSPLLVCRGRNRLQRFIQHRKQHWSRIGQPGKKKKATREHEKEAWLREKNGLLKQTQALEKEKEDLLAEVKHQDQMGSMHTLLLEQLKEREMKLQTQIASLTATVDEYKQKEVDQLKASNQALHQRLFKQKEKENQEQQTMELVEKVAKYKETTLALREELLMSRTAHSQVRGISRLMTVVVVVLITIILVVVVVSRMILKPN
jgi:hypothetical protein